MSEPSKLDYERAVSAIESLGLEDRINRPCNSLSGGQMQLVMLAAQIMYPDLFSDIDIKAETIKYYQTFFDYTPTDDQITSILNGNG